MGPPVNVTVLRSVGDQVPQSKADVVGVWT